MKHVAWLVILIVSLTTVVIPHSQAATMRVGENWLGGGQVVAQDLAAYGGSVYNTYYQAPEQDGEPQRVRLMRYPYMTVTSAQVAGMNTKGLYWALGNEQNNADQDGGLLSDAQAVQYVAWYKSNAAAIKAGDPTAKILGPSVIGWTYYNTPPQTVSGLVAYQRFLSVYKAQYGGVPTVDVLNYHSYPIRYELTSVTEGEFDEQLNLVVNFAQSRGWGIAVTEWSFWAEHFNATCSSAQQSEASQYNYVMHGLQSMAQRGVLMALFFGNVHQSCDNNGHAAWLFNSNGSLTASGRAHRDFVQGTVPVTNTPVITNTTVPTVTPTRISTSVLTPTSTRTAATVITNIPTVTRIPTVTPRPGCVPTFIKKC